MWSTRIMILVDDEKKIEEEKIREVVRRYKEGLERDLANVIPR